jgi:hypothetical protein
MRGPRRGTLTARTDSRSVIGGKNDNGDIGTLTGTPDA